MQMKIFRKRYLVIRYSYTIKNSKKEKIIPKIFVNNKWKRIDLFEDYLITLVDYNIDHKDKQVKIKETMIDLVKCFELLMCVLLAVLSVIYLLDIIKRW